MQKTAPSAPPPEFWEKLIERLDKTGNVDPAALAKAIAEVKKPWENTVTHEISYKNPRGRDYPLPRLACEIFTPYRNHPDDNGFTREELELANLLIEGAQRRVEKGHLVGFFTYTKTDNEEENITVTAQRHDKTGKVERVQVMCDQFKKEARGNRFPGLRHVFREMLEQETGDLPERAKAVLTMKDEIRKIAAGELAVTR